MRERASSRIRAWKTVFVCVCCLAIGSPHDLKELCDAEPKTARFDSRAGARAVDGLGFGFISSRRFESQAQKAGNSRSIWLTCRPLCRWVKFTRTSERRHGNHDTSSPFRRAEPERAQAEASGQYPAEQALKMDGLRSPAKPDPGKATVAFLDSPGARAFWRSSSAAAGARSAGAGASISGGCPKGPSPSSLPGSIGF